MREAISQWQRTKWQSLPFLTTLKYGKELRPLLLVIFLKKTPTTQPFVFPYDCTLFSHLLSRRWLVYLTLLTIFKAESRAREILVSQTRGYVLQISRQRSTQWLDFMKGCEKQEGNGNTIFLLWCRNLDSKLSDQSRIWHLSLIQDTPYLFQKS